MDYKNWFESRGLRTLDYQLDILENKLPQSLAENQKPTVLAACPSAGKTLMSIAFLDGYLKDNPGHRVLVLTHGTTVLRDQYHQVLEESQPGFTFEEVTAGQDVRKSTAQVVVCLPHAFDGKRKCPHFDLLIVDEAHQLYFAEKRVKSVIKRVRPRKQLLLTGTPSSFIWRKYPIIPVAVNKLLEEDMVEDLLVELASSTYNFTNEDYNANNDLKEDAQILAADTRATLNDLLTGVEARLTSVIKQHPKLYSGVKNVTGWSASLTALRKTMFACKSQEQAQQVAQYFRDKGVDVALSISDEGDNSAEIARFAADPDCPVLIVVGRGILGFNLPELENVVDMTCSHNIDRLFQLMCRVIRKHPEGRKKLYFKVVPHHLEEYFYHVMNCVVCLTNKEYFLKYNGKNFLQLKIPVMLQKRERSGRNGKRTGKRPGKIRPVIIAGLPAIKLMNDILHVTHGELNSYAYTTMQAVRGEFLLQVTFWTDEMLVADAQEWEKLKEWRKASPSAHSTAWARGILDQCCAHMEGKKWTNGAIIESAQKCGSIGEWQAASPGAYPAARSQGILDKCCAHMTSRKIMWTKEMLIESAQPCGSSKEWKAASPNAYAAAQRRGILDQCCSHMTPTAKPSGFWKVKKNCVESARSCRSITEWIAAAPAAYTSARNHGWLDECRRHMTEGNKPRGFWGIKKNCVESARSCRSITEWISKGGGAYASASLNGWLDECRKHMKRKPWGLNKKK